MKTMLEGVELPAKAFFSDECDGYYYFRTSVPVSDTLPSRSSKQIFLKIKELPGDSRAHPQKLSSWLSLQLSIIAEAGFVIKPELLNVRKFQVGPQSSGEGLGRRRVDSGHRHRCPKFPEV